MKALFTRVGLVYWNRILSGALCGLRIGQQGRVATSLCSWNKWSFCFSALRKCFGLILAHQRLDHQGQPPRSEEALNRGQTKLAAKTQERSSHDERHSRIQSSATSS